MSNRLIRSLIMLVLIVAVSAPTAYAALVTNTVALAGNTISTATAEMAICNSNEDLWTNTLTSTFSLSNLAPGATQSLTTTETIYIGNDDGNLDSGSSSSLCADYAASYTPGTSGIEMEVVPSVSNINCGDNFNLANQLQLEVIVEDQSSGFISLNNWSFNTTSVGASITPGSTVEINANSTLANDFDVQGGSCTFDLQLRGRQI